MDFIKATKEKTKLRLAMFGPSGSGKTFTALRVAAGIGGKIAFVDTERRSARKYSDRFEFDVLDLDQTSVDNYIEAIKAAGQAGYDVLIIDSLTHGWHDLLDEVDRLAKSKYRGNTWSAWSEGTPKQHKMVDALLSFPGHIIATMRTKTEWTTETDRNGKTKPVRIGLSPEQGKGIEYEFDLLIELSPDHIANIIKDRSGRFQDKTIDKPGEDFGAELAQWLSDGVEAKPKKQAKAPKSSPQPEPEQPPTTPAPNGDGPMTVEQARALTTPKGTPLGQLTPEQLQVVADSSNIELSTAATLLLNYTEG